MNIILYTEVDKVLFALRDILSPGANDEESTKQPPERLESLIAGAQVICEICMRNTGRAPEFFLGANRRNVYHLTKTSFQPGCEYYYPHQSFLIFCCAYGITEAVSVCGSPEFYAPDAMKMLGLDPSSESKVEFVSLTCEVIGQVWLKVLPVVRDQNGKFLNFGEPKFAAVDLSKDKGTEYALLYAEMSETDRMHCLLRMRGGPAYGAS